MPSAKLLRYLWTVFLNAGIKNVVDSIFENWKRERRRTQGGVSYFVLTIL